MRRGGFREGRRAGKGAPRATRHGEAGRRGASGAVRTGDSRGRDGGRRGGRRRVEAQKRGQRGQAGAARRGRPRGAVRTEGSRGQRSDPMIHDRIGDSAAPIPRRGRDRMPPHRRLPWPVGRAIRDPSTATPHRRARMDPDGRRAEARYLPPRVSSPREPSPAAGNLPRACPTSPRKNPWSRSFPAARLSSRARPLRSGRRRTGWLRSALRGRRWNGAGRHGERGPPGGAGPPTRQPPSGRGKGDGGGRRPPPPSLQAVAALETAISCSACACCGCSSGSLST